MKYISILLLALLLTACDDDERKTEKRDKDNHYSLRNPEVIGTTFNGQVVYHSTIEVRNSSYEQHLFFVGPVVTTDTRVSTGKTTRPKVSATISTTEDPEAVVIDGEPVSL